MERYIIHVSKPYTIINRFENRRGVERILSKVKDVYMAVGKMLKPVRADLTTIKGQLDGISTAIDDLTKRIEEIEKMLKEEKVKVA